MLAKAKNLMKIIFGVDGDDTVLTEHRISRMCGAILLNGQERSPTSPWNCYVSWLKETGNRVDRKAVRSITKNNPNLEYSSRGQGVYKICSCFNHSCDPNLQVTYGDDNDETLVAFAIKDIKIGDEICISYIDESAPRKERQEQLSEHYFFDCICEKCEEEK